MIYGYAGRTVNDLGLIEIREVSASTSPDALRTLAAFLIEAADTLEFEPISRNWHKHSPQALRRALGCDFIVLATATEECDGLT